MSVRRPVLLAVLTAVALLLPAGGAVGSGGRAGDPLEVYVAEVSRAQLSRLVADGVDVAATRDVAGGRVQVDLVLSASERRALAGRGVATDVKRNRDGKSARQLAAEQASGGYTVWRSYDEPGGIRDELYRIAQRNPRIAKLSVVGRSLQGREILALKITKDATRTADGTRPAALFTAAQHAREWISVEVNRRLLRHVVDGYGRDARLTRLVDTRELWFVLVANPDGYQHSFDSERLWRKNLRDNDGDGALTNADGVDLNRNFDEHWRYDEEGSSSTLSSQTYRGSSAGSEPETQAYQGLLQRLRPAFLVNYHSYGQLLLYSFGWQVQTPSADDPVFVALSGTDEQPAIAGYDPGVSADLYTTNGETGDYAHARTGTLAWTPELGEGVPGNGFLFPDDEDLVQREFLVNLPFALDVAESAAHPATPVSHLGRSAEPFSVDAFDVSYGDPQVVQARAARHLGPVTMRYRVNGGPAVGVPTTEWAGGERYGGAGDVHYAQLRGRVTGTSPGDRVTVWFEGGGRTSEPFTYTARSETRRPVLVLAAEDYTGASPVYRKTDGPSYLSYYLDALAASGVQADVYDVDANGRRAPDALGVLSHYRAVVWYTGDDIITRERGMVPGTASRLANDLVLAARDYLNEGGRLLYTGKYAGFQNAFGYEFDPVANAPCDPSSDADGCVPLSDDFLQYYLGAYLYNDDAGTQKGRLHDVAGAAALDGLTWSFGAPSANNQDHSASFITTSGVLPAAQFPQFSSTVAGRYLRPGSPFEPRTGSHYVYSQVADVSYKRLTRTVDLTGAGSGDLSFWLSRDTEADWDYVLVEARTAGQDDWTTLPDRNGHTSTSTGESCAAGWHELHPFLARYQTRLADGTCTATGTSGSWNAASGRSSGWEQWSVDLSRWAGRQVEVSLTYVSDWSIQGLGVFVDDTATSTGETTSFEDGLGGWTIASAPPPGSAPNANTFVRTTAAGFPEGAAVQTPDTLYFGFGLEGIAGPAQRTAVMRAALAHLLR